MFIVFILFQFLPFIIVPIIIISISVRVHKQRKNIDQAFGDFKNTISNANDPNAYGNSISAEDIDTYCAYCGSKFSRIKKKCTACGASNDDKK